MLDFRVLFASTVLVACAHSPRYRTELVGYGNGTVSSRVVATQTDPVGAPGAGGIQLAQGNYEVSMRFDVPRAQLIDWKIVCPGVDVDGQAGETFEQYRERRIAQIVRDREAERARVSTATSLVVGAIAPRASTSARVGNVHVNGRASVDPNAVGDAVANGAVSNVIELAPGDVGRGSVVATARVITSGDGVCALQASADDSEVTASFTVTRIRDLEAEDRMRTIAAREVAVKARGQLTATLVTQGADPSVRQKRIDIENAKIAAQAQAKFDARAKVEAQMRARADLRARWEAQAIYARQEYLAYLSGKCNAEPGRRDRVAEDERRRREARLVAYAEVAQHREQVSLRARATLRGQLIALGAKERPPMPPPKPENPGDAPFQGAEWTAGYWSWVSGGWEWEDGGWMDPTVLGDGGYSTVEVGVGVAPAHTYQTGVRDHRRRTQTEDHRGGGGGGVRDYIGGNSSKRDEPKVRDHRDESRPKWEPKPSDPPPTRVRDHRDDKKDDDKKDDKPVVRDHRR